MDAAMTERFEANRSRLASIAYRLLGSAADAEDTVQDAFLRWEAADRSHVDVPEAWLTKVVTNLALDRLRSAKVRHERAVGAWMPEPLLQGDPMLDPAETFEQRESVTLAVLTIMERLSPVERAVYVLYEAFSYRHAEIADFLDITESASQQHAHRARQRVAAERTRTEVDRASAHRIVTAFIDAASSGETEKLVALLTDDAVAISDGAGGTATKLLRITGPEQIANALRIGYKPTPAKRRLVGGAPSLYSTVLNGSPALVVTVDDRVVAALGLDVRGDKITTVRGMANQARFDRLTRQWRQNPSGVLILESW